MKAVRWSRRQAELAGTVATVPATTSDELAAKVTEERVWGDLMALAEHVEPGLPGWTRRVFTDPYRQSRTLVATLMERAGLRVRRDAVGNLIGELAGTDPALPALVIGSHTDTVAGGGRFDGMVGVAAGVEVARCLAGSSLRHPLWVVDFLGEEPNDFGLSCVGSRAVTGHLTQEHLGLRDDSGRTLADALQAAGSDPANVASARWHQGSVHAYLELHIEQGRALEQAGSRLGVVTAIVGIARAVIDLVGAADHAGTTAMSDRRDALVAAAEVVLGVESIGRRGKEERGVATTGRIVVQPNAANVIPASAQLLVEMRSTSARWLREQGETLEQVVAQVASARAVEAGVGWLSREPPVPCNPRLRELLRGALDEMGVTAMELESGASHDAAHLARIAPMGMIFVPSHGGRSHCPEEWTAADQVADGTRALLRATLAADREQL